MALSEQHSKELILSSINFLKSGSNKDHNYLTMCLNKLLPALEAMKEDGFSFQHIVKVDDILDRYVHFSNFDMDDVEELERFIDGYTVNDICYGSPEDYALPKVFDKHMLTEYLLIVQSV